MSEQVTTNPPAIVDDLVKKNQGLVHVIARQWARSGLDYEDLVAEGNVGLVIAAQRYDASIGKFSTYAVHWIRQSIARFVENRRFDVRVPNSLQRKVREFRRGERGSSERIDQALSVMRPSFSLDAPVSSDDERASLEFLAAGSPSAEEVLGEEEERAQREAALRAALESMPRRLRLIAEERFLNGKTLAEVGDMLGLSRERIRQLESMAFAALKRRLQGELSASPERVARERAQRRRESGADEPAPEPREIMEAHQDDDGHEWVDTAKAAEIVDVSRSWFTCNRDREHAFGDKRAKLIWRASGGGFLSFRLDTVHAVAEVRRAMLGMEPRPTLVSIPACTKTLAVDAPEPPPPTRSSA